jgi:hypothetical protein
MFLFIFIFITQIIYLEWNHETLLYTIFMSSETSPCFGPNIFLRTLFLNTLNLCFSLCGLLVLDTEFQMRIKQQAKLCFWFLHWLSHTNKCTVMILLG